MGELEAQLEIYEKVYILSIIYRLMRKLKKNIKNWSLLKLIWLKNHKLLLFNLPRLINLLKSWKKEFKIKDKVHLVQFQVVKNQEYKQFLH